MRIAYFTESLPPQTDGVAKTLSRLMETLEASGIDFRFYSPFKPGTAFKWSERVRKVLSLPIFLYSEYRLAVPFLHPLTWELDRYKPDLVHVASPSLLGLFGLSYARRRHVKAVSSYHTHFISYLPYYGLKKAEDAGWKFLKWFHNQFHRTYAPSRSAAGELTQRGIKGVEKWPRGVECDKFSPAFRNDELRRECGAGERPILLFVGRLVKEKDLDDLVDADRILAHAGHEYKIVIVGDGPMRPELETAMPDAFFTGYQHGHRLSEWYASSDIFVFPSTTETFGNVILEAYSSGVPAVGVNKGGVTDIINHDVDGFLAKPNNPRHFADHVGILLKDPKRRRDMSSSARETARRFSWENVNGALIQSYRNLLVSNN